MSAQNFAPIKLLGSVHHTMKIRSSEMRHLRRRKDIQAIMPDLQSPPSPTPFSPPLAARRCPLEGGRLPRGGSRPDKYYRSLSLRTSQYILAASASASSYAPISSPPLPRRAVLVPLRGWRLPFPQLPGRRRLLPSLAVPCSHPASDLPAPSPCPPPAPPAGPQAQARVVSVVHLNDLIGCSEGGSEAGGAGAGSGEGDQSLFSNASGLRDRLSKQLHRRNEKKRKKTTHPFTSF